MTNEPVNLVELPELSRRTFLQFVGGGLVVVVAAELADSQEQQQPARGRRGGGGGGGGGRGQQPIPLAARVRIDKDGNIIVFTGKVEGGQGARTELTQAAAEELRVSPDRIKLVMADTAAVPDDGITAGSRSTPSTMPAVRAGCAAAREALIAIAAQRWKVDPQGIDAHDGQVRCTDRSVSYGELAADEAAVQLLAKNVPPDAAVTSVKDWKVLGTSVRRPNARELVTGAHHFPSDITLSDMLYGKVLRPPGFGAKLVSIDLAAGRTTPRAATNGTTDGTPSVTVVRDGDFIGVAAPTSRAATKAIVALNESARWEPSPRPPSTQLFQTLRDKAKGSPQNPLADALARAARPFKQTYEVAYIQHAPMEPRAAVAQWDGDGRLTVWTASQNPFGVRNELSRAFGLNVSDVRVIIPDFGGGFGGKHTGECAIEAARLAKLAGKPVSLRWTRGEEFAWAYFRPAAVIDIAAGLDEAGAIAAWQQVNINSGAQAIESPYRINPSRGEFVPSDPPLRHGSYRSLAATANNFAREVAMDELAVLAGRDPLEFRLAHIDGDRPEGRRLRAVLETAAKKIGWPDLRVGGGQNSGVGIACGVEKGSYIATCAAVEVNPSDGTIRVPRVAAAYDCGKIVNPNGLLRQTRGAIVMGIGAALRERIEFDETGRVTNATFWKYQVPRFADVPARFDVELIDRPDLPSAGAGETPIICIAPAIANAVFHATGARLRQMPLQLKPA